MHLHQGLAAIATPVHTATVAAAAITQYAPRDTQDAIDSARYTDFGKQLTLVDALLSAEPVDGPFDTLSAGYFDRLRASSFDVHLRWQVQAPTPTGLYATIALRDPAGHLWAEVGQPMLNGVYFGTSAWEPGEWADASLEPKLPKRIPPDIYAVLLTVTDAGGKQLGAWDADGKFQGVRVILGEVEIAPPAEPAGPAPCAEDHALAAGPLLACVPDLPQQTTVPSGDTLTLALTWSSTAAPGADYRVRWRLLASAGSMALEQIENLSPYATSRWRAGDSFESHYDLRFDPELAAGGYQLALNVLAPDGHSLWADDEVLSAVEVTPRQRLFELPAGIAYPLDLTLGSDVHLRGFDLSPPPAEEGSGERVLQPGDTPQLTLYWQAGGPTDLDYTVFAHLVGPDGRPHGQVDTMPAGGAAPTTSWAPGQVIVDELAIPVAADGPAGAYHVAIGMYDAASGGRLPITDASGEPLPNDQVVLPVEITVTGGQR